MPIHPMLSLTGLLLLLPLAAAATTVNRCHDQGGNVTFTTLSCGAGQDTTAVNIPGIRHDLHPSDDESRRTASAQNQGGGRRGAA